MLLKYVNCKHFVQYGKKQVLQMKQFQITIGILRFFKYFLNMYVLVNLYAY